MSEIIARFADGRLLVQESRKVEYRYCGSGVPVRIGHVRAIESVLSLTTDYDKYGLVTPLSEAWVGYRISGGVWSGAPQEKADHLMVVMRRGDIAILASGVPVSGTASPGMMSGITSGLGYLTELVSGNVGTSGIVTVKANIIGY